MRLYELEQQDHPFNYAYSVQNAGDLQAIRQAYTWAANEYGSNLPMPPVMVANHEHVQRAAKQANHNTVISGHVFGWYSQRYGKVFISDKLNPGRRKQDAAVLVHEFIHYMQDHDNKPNNVAELEKEADSYMHRYSSGA